MRDGVVIDSDSVGDEGRHLLLADLERMLDGLPRPPAERGRIAIVARRGPGGLRETPIGWSWRRMWASWETPGAGSRSPIPNTQLAVMQSGVAELIANGQPLTLFGDNLFLDLDLSTGNLPPGSRVRVGAAVLEVTPVPHNGCQKFRSRFRDAALRFVARRDRRARNLRGIYMRVVEAGEIGPGDPVEVISRSPLTGEA